MIPLEIDAATGVPTLLPPGTATGDQPVGALVHPSGNFAYAAILDPSGTGAVETFGVDLATGDLTGLDSSTAGTNPREIALDPSGRYLYASNEGSDDVTLFSVDQATGLPTNTSSTAAGTAPADLVLTASFMTPAPSDCNTNGVPDHMDISMGTSFDCNGNCIPDECETPDCNANGVPDECDLAFGASLDCNTNAVPDECDLSSGFSQDCNGNGIPDDCDPDCDLNGTPDDCEGSLDCNLNGIPDRCDLALGASLDTNLNGIPDECECGSATNYCVTRPRSSDVQRSSGSKIGEVGLGVPDSCRCSR